MRIEDYGNNKNETAGASLEGNEWVLPSNLEVIEQATDAFNKKLEETGWDLNKFYGLETGFREALMNAIIHGNLGLVKKDDNENLHEKVKKYLLDNPKEGLKKVYVSLDINGERIYIKIRDEGKGFNVKQISNPTNSTELMKTKGRGIFYMRQFFDSVEYIGNGNAVVLSKEKKE